MAEVLPSKLADLVAFVGEHVPVWTAAPATAIGLTAEQLAALSAQHTDTTEKIAEKTAAEFAARAATLAQGQSGRDLRSLASAAVRSIKTFAEAQSKPDLIYAQAQISPPSPPLPVPAPTQPTDLTVTIDPTSGAITLKWKANQNGVAGTTYLIYRKAQGESGFQWVGATGTKEFLDSTFTAGPDSVQYYVQGTRSGLTGQASSILMVSFGVPGGSSFTSNVLEAPKLAA